MDEQKKEVMQVLIKGRQYIYSLLHQLIGAEPTMEMLEAAVGKESFQVISLFEGEENTAALMLKEALLPLRQMDRSILDRIRQEYTDLFIGPRELIAPPWESVYLTRERALFQASTLAVRQWYQQHGFLPAGYPRHPDDHISLMMHFLALLSGEALACFREDRFDAYQNNLESQKLFIENHLMNWLPRYAKDMKQAETALLYPQLAAALSRLVEEDHRLIGELLISLGVESA